MKRVITVVFAGIVLSLASCLETGTSTSINADGSGMFLQSADISGMMKMMNDPGGLKTKKDSVRIDTTIYLRNAVGDMGDLSAEEKNLVREMMVKVKIDLLATEPVFLFSFITVFGNFEELNRIRDFMRTREFEKLITRVLNKALDDKGDNKEEDMDDMLNIMFLGIYKTEYKKGSIVCQADTTTELYRKSIAISMAGETEGIDPKDPSSLAMRNSKFTTIITLPSPVKELKGGAMVKGKSDKELVMTGNYFDLYRDPKKYEYSISY